LICKTSVLLNKISLPTVQFNVQFYFIICVLERSAIHVPFCLYLARYNVIIGFIHQ